ncbi:MAG: hypothetical protein MHM6MM_000820 [Cercozoa sp. M6MM]
MSCPFGKGITRNASHVGLANEVRPKRGTEPVYYHDYLALDQILTAQKPKSLEVGGELAHDEMLFITIHQTYELWFKQILHELESCATFLTAEFIAEKKLLVIVSRLRRVCEILKVLVSQMKILETMTPQDFLEFRDFLYPASGFQSVQFRTLENRLGLPRDKRVRYRHCEYTERLSEEHARQVEAAEEERKPSMFTLVERWLCRTPFLQEGWQDGWFSEYRAAVAAMLAEDEAAAELAVTEEDKKAQLESVTQQRAAFEDIFDPEKYEVLRQKGRRRLSYKAMQAALFIQLYRHEPAFQMPFQLITCLQDIDELLTQWRYTHALVVRRMLGSKMGTGGSSGFDYLKATASFHKVFDDFFAMSSYIVPASALPALPDAIKMQLRHGYETAFRKRSLASSMDETDKSDEADQAHSF